jgi:hypothetical protein
VADMHLERLYKEVFFQVYPDIKSQERGVLSRLIYMLLLEEERQAETICRYVDIRSNDYREDDKKVVNNLMNNAKELFPLDPRNFLNDANQTELFWIVSIACALVGVLACVKYVDFKKGLARGSNQPQSSETVTPQPVSLPITATLCLIVPASIISNRNQGDQLAVEDMELLIDKAPYFLCTTIDDANLKQQYLTLMNEKIPFDSDRDVYVRIHINDGRNMLGKKSPYMLKSRLPLHGQGLIVKLACLKDLSGLEAFDHI